MPKLITSLKNNLRRTVPYKVVKSNYRYYRFSGKDQIKIVLITGVAKGLGCLLARHYIEDGFKVIGVDIVPASKLDRAISQGLLEYIEFDLRNINDIESLIEGLYTRHKRVDLLINNAGILNFKRIYDYTPAEIHDMLTVNLTSIMVLIRSILPRMVKQQFGRIINVSSKAAFQGEDKFGVYSPSKVGVMLLGESIGKLIDNEHWKNNVTINTINPDRINTPEYLEANPGIKPTSLISSQEIYKKIQRIVTSQVNGETFPMFSYWKRTSFLFQHIQKLFL
jgi:NAD(P)-dependent dehydrogenase (short-subunit alcohol dehydrogenase family)